MSQPRMHSKEKLLEAQYFLNAVSQTRAKPDEFNYNLSAYLGACYSAMQLMLYDFAEKYCLGLTREDNLSDHEFRIASKALKHADALEFLQWWRKAMARLGQHQLWNRRKLVVHRGYLPELFKYTIFVSGATPMFPGHSPGTTGVFEQLAQPPLRPLSPSRPPAAIPAIYLPDVPNVEVPDLCQQLLDELSRIVHEAETVFWT